jgi:hypothetical protein
MISDIGYRDGNGSLREEKRLGFRFDEGDKGNR